MRRRLGGRESSWGGKLTEEMWTWSVHHDNLLKRLLRLSHIHGNFPPSPQKVLQKIRGAEHLTAEELNVIRKKMIRAYAEHGSVRSVVGIFRQFVKHKAVDRDLVDRVVNSLSPGSALAVLRFVREHSSYVTREHYTDVLRRCYETDRPNMVDRTVSRMEEIGMRMDVEGMAVYFWSFIVQQHPDKAVSAFATTSEKRPHTAAFAHQRAVELCLAPKNKQDFTSFMQQQTSLAQFFGATRGLTSVRAGSYAAMALGTAKMGKREISAVVSKAMLTSKHLKPQAEEYNKLVTASIRCGEDENVRKLISTMKRRGEEQSPNVT